MPGAVDLSTLRRRSTAPARPALLFSTSPAPVGSSQITEGKPWSHSEHKVLLRVSCFESSFRTVEIGVLQRRTELPASCSAEVVSSMICFLEPSRNSEWAVLSHRERPVRDLRMFRIRRKRLIPELMPSANHFGDARKRSGGEKLLREDSVLRLQAKLTTSWPM